MQIKSTGNTPEDLTMVQRPEMQGMHVWWLVSKESVGAQKVLLDVAEFPPHINHGLHRHPNAEEVIYLLEGEGYHLSEGDPQLQHPGEAVYVPAGEWHGFHNHTDEPATIISAWGGVASIADAGYEEYPAAPQSAEPTDTK